MINNFLEHLITAHPNVANNFFNIHSELLFLAGTGKATTSLNNTFKNGTYGIMAITAMFGALMFAFGGVLYQSGSQEAMQKGKKRWLSATIGLVVVIGAITIASYIKDQANGMK